MHAHLRRAVAATIATGALMAAGLVAPADAGPGPAHGHANGHGKGHCRALHAFGEGMDNGDNTTSATLYRARGKRELGTTVGTLVPGEIVDGVLSFTGNLVFTGTTGTTGTLDALLEGTFDTSTGDFAATSTAVTGTDAYADVTGKLRIRGTQDLATGEFTEHLVAKLCVPKTKQH